MKRFMHGLLGNRNMAAVDCARRFKHTRRVLFYERDLAGVVLTRGGTPINAGSMTTACVPRQRGPMRAVDIPPDIVTKLRAVTGPNDDMS
jgi:hypothetical protein